LTKLIFEGGNISGDRVTKLWKSLKELSEEYKEILEKASKSSPEKLSEFIQKLAEPLKNKQIVIINGSHLSMLLDDYGYCELEFPEYCVSWMKYIFQLIRESGPSQPRG